MNFLKMQTWRNKLSSKQAAVTVLSLACGLAIPEQQCMAHL